jgi:hypothetical protein
VKSGTPAGLVVKLGEERREGGRKGPDIKQALAEEKGGDVKVLGNWNAAVLRAISR